MSRRPKTAPTALSASWKDYRPDDGLYWRLGGPFIPADQIAPHEVDVSHYQSTAKPASRARFVREVMENAERDLARSLGLYEKLEAEGVAGQPHPFQIDEDRRLDQNPGDWSMVCRNFDRIRASCFRSIGFERGRIAGCRRLLEQLDADCVPLFAWRTSRQAPQPRS